MWSKASPGAHRALGCFVPPAQIPPEAKHEGTVDLLRLLSCCCLAAGWLGCSGQLRAAVPAETPQAYSEASEKVKWSAAQSDCHHRIALHRRMLIDDSRLAADQIVVQAGNGTRLYFSRSVSAARVIDELEIRLPIKSDRRGLQLLARIVLPRTVDPDTGERITVLVGGDLYHQTNDWQTLDLREIPRLMNEKVRCLRSEMPFRIDSREAYVDLVAVNVFGGVGQTKVWLGDCEVDGFVPSNEISPTTNDQTSLASYAAANSTTALEPPHPSVRLAADKLVVEGRPFFPRVVDGNGESFQFLKDLGFNCVALPGAPTEAQLVEARQTGTWLVSPVPSRRTIVCNLGCAKASANLRQAGGIQNDPGHASRNFRMGQGLFIADASVEQRMDTPGLANIHLHEGAPCFQGQGFSSYGRWLWRRIQRAAPQTIHWSSIETGAPLVLSEQLTAFGFNGSECDVPDYHQLRNQVLTSICAGVRGLWFRSSQRLDTATDLANKRSDALQLLNLELDLLNPWIANGKTTGDVTAFDQPFRGQVLSAYRSELIIVQRDDPQAHHVRQSRAPADASLLVNGIPDSSDILRFSATGLSPVVHQRITGGVRVDLPGMKSVELMIATRNQPALTHTSRKLEKSAGTRTRLLQSIAERQLREARDVIGRLSTYGGVAPKLDQALDREMAKLTRSVLMYRAGEYANAQRLTEEIDRAVSQVRHSVWQTFVGGSPWPTADPCLSQFATLPILRQVAARLSSDHLSMAGLGAEHFDSLDKLIITGWDLKSTAEGQGTCQISLVREDSHEGNWCLRLRAGSEGIQCGALNVGQQPLAAARSAAKQVARGDVVRITGRIKLVDPCHGETAPLVIFDSLGRRDLALHCGPTKDWQEFEMIRAAANASQLRVNFELWHPGEVWIDDVSTAIVDSPSRSVRIANAEVAD